MIKFEKLFNLSRRMYLSGHRILPRILQRYCRLIYHCDIPVTADIAPDAYFCHNAFGVVIHPNAVIGGVQLSSIVSQLGSLTLMRLP